MSILAKPDSAAATEEATLLLNDVREPFVRMLRVWGKAHRPEVASLNPAQHMIAVLQGATTAVAEVAANLARSNPEADADWLRNALVGQFDLVWQANIAPADKAKGS